MVRLIVAAACGLMFIVGFFLGVALPTANRPVNWTWLLVAGLAMVIGLINARFIKPTD